MRILLLNSLLTFQVLAVNVGDIVISIDTRSNLEIGQIAIVQEVFPNYGVFKTDKTWMNESFKDQYWQLYNEFDPSDSNESSSFYMEVSGNGFYTPPSIYVGTPTDSSTVTQDENGHIVTTPNTGSDNVPTFGTTPTNPGDNNGTFSNVLTPNYSLQVDQDNDVPTLLAILSKLDSLDQDNDNYLLQQILDELKSQNLNDTGLAPTDVDYANITFDKETTNILPGNINPFESVTPSGSMPNLSLSVPSLTGPTSVSIDLTDPKYDNLFLVAKAGLTAVFVFASIRFTAWSSGTLLSS